MFKHIIDKIKRRVRNWKNNCNRDAKCLPSLPDKEMTQIDKKNTTFPPKKKIGQRTPTVFRKAI